MAAIIIILTVVVDQLSKILTVRYLKPIGSVSLIDGVFSLTYVENTGAAFGILKNHRWVFISITIVICIGLLIYLIKSKDIHLVAKISLALIIGGAIGNLIDRIFVGHVTDMFHVTLINFAVFNVADSAVVVGTFLFVYYILFLEGKEKKPSV